MPARQVWTKFSVPRYVKLTLPHAALILLCLVYITMGAFVFFSIESPHEIALKKAYCQRIRETTMDYIDVLWSNRRQSTVTETRKQWQTQLNRGLLNITNVLYAAFVTDYISYSLIDLNQTDGLSKALENSWTLKSSLFFSTTTIVTIGYGNIVPATAHGRLLCILFALFGCPLAIITVGDLGKFLSEFVVHCYNKTQKIKKALMQRVTEWPTFPAKIILNCDSDVLSLHYEDLILGEENISASVVISIFLTYNTIGALIFKITEGWSFMDSFYFCFISITTVGFGDFVPKHDPWHIMVTCYTAVGIGITTMCIDLVGTRYITKLHYFGRKLRGGDLMRYLRRKRIRDSKILLAARAAETIEAYLKNFDRSGREESALMILSEPEFIDKGGHDTIEKTEIALTINLPVTVQHAEKVINKNFVCSMHSIQGDLEVRHESSILGNTHAKDRENTYTMQLFPLVPLTDSGSKSSLSSVRDSCESPNDQLKREMIRNYALAQLAGLPSGTAAKSLPNILPLLPISLHERQWKSCQASLEDNVLPQTEQPKLHIDVGPEIGNEYDDSALSTPSGQNMSPLNNNEGEDELLTSTISQRLTECSLPTLSPDGDQLGQKKFSMPDLDSPSEWPTKLRKNMTFMLEGSSLKHGYVAKSSSNWTWHTYPAKYYFSNDMKVFERVNVTFAKKELVNARLLSTDKKRREGSISSTTIKSFSILTANEFDNGRKETSKKSKQREELDLNCVYKVTRTYSFWKTCTSFHCICTKIEPCKATKKKQENYFVVQYVWRNAKEKDILKVEQEIRRKELSCIPDFLIHCQ